MIKSIEFTEEEINAGISNNTLKQAISIYNDDGCLLLKNVFSEGYINNLNTSFKKKYSRFFKNKVHENALEVGNQRFMVTIKMETPFNSHKLYANTLVFPIIKALLGEECILNGFGSVISLPGALDQDPHYDHPPLFKENIEVSAKIPSHAITMIVPFVELNQQTGTTVMMPKSHCYPQDITANYGLTYDFPLAPLGSVLLMDYRLKHYGMANRSEIVRPIMYNIYSRPWFRDYVNYEKQPPLEISKKDYLKIPDEYKHLFLFANQK